MTLMLVDHRSDMARPLRHATGYLTAPIHFVAHFPQALVGWVADQARSRDTLRSENARLERQLLVAQQNIQRLAVLEAENIRLRALLNSSAEIDARALVAEIIGIEPAPARRELVINKGTVSGVHVGQAVLDAEGLVGQVIDVGPLTARVLMIVDASHALSVQVNRSGMRAILAGTGVSDRMRLLYVPDTADIVPGDLLVTTGLDQRFPRGYPVAEVVSVTQAPGAAFASIEAYPAAQLDRVTHVMLVQNQTAETGATARQEVGP